MPTRKEKVHDNQKNRLENEDPCYAKASSFKFERLEKI